MPLLDRRIKQCPNESCDKYKNAKFKPSDLFCVSCGTELVFVCKKCGSKIVDEGPSHTLCARCEAKRQDRIDTLKEGAKNVGAVAAAAATFVFSYKNIPQDVKDTVGEMVKRVEGYINH